MEGHARSMQRLTRRLRRAVRHPIKLARASTELAAVHLALRCVSFPTLLRWLAPPVQGIAPSPAALDPNDLWAINAAGRLMFGQSGCLRRALAVCWHCRRRAIPAELRIGVARGEDGIEAHAWVELDGRVVTGGPERYVRRFAPLGNPTASELDLFDLAR
jgi:hypothetical protein